MFALSLSRAAGREAQVSSILMMSVVGGAVGPLLTGIFADRASMSAAFVVPMVSFAVVGLFALYCLRPRH